jgi:hypothetical protein
MPYHVPHRAVRDRIVDLEIMKLELRKISRPHVPLRGGDLRTTDRRAMSPRRGA